MEFVTSEFPKGQDPVVLGGCEGATFFPPIRVYLLGNVTGLEWLSGSLLPIAIELFHYNMIRVTTCVARHWTPQTKGKMN